MFPLIYEVIIIQKRDKDTLVGDLAKTATKLDELNLFALAIKVILLRN